MTEMLTLAVILLGASFTLALLGMLRQRSPTDRILIAQLLGSNGVGLLLLLSLLQEQLALLDVALVLAILSVVVVIAFTRGRGERQDA